MKGGGYFLFVGRATDVIAHYFPSACP